MKKSSQFACLILAGICSAAISVAQEISAPDPQPGTITGTVLDINGGVVPNATVLLNGSEPDEQRSITTGDNGFFQLISVRPGADYHIVVRAHDFTDWNSSAITVSPGQYIILKGIQLQLEVVQTTIAALTPEQIATEQVKAEEKQRVLGIVPNFYVVYDPHPAPLTAKLKFQLAERALTDPVTVAGLMANAGIYQLARYPDYHSNAEGFGQRVGATFAGAYANIFVGDALLPTLLHQDPRFFYEDTGTTRSRVLYALSTPFETHGDDGRREFNYSGILGDVASGAMANVYYPSSDRGSSLVVRSALIGTAGRAINGLVQELVLNRPTFRRSKNPW
jgi:hypothetical protein